MTRLLTPFRRFCRISSPGLAGQGYFAPLNKAIKSVVSIPVLLTGGITEVSAAEKLLNTQVTVLTVGALIAEQGK